MIGQLIENIKTDQVIAPVQSATEATLYNGSAITVSNNGIDTKGYDQVNFVLNAGELVGDAVVNVSIFESDTNNPANATLLSGLNSDATSTNATFTQITSANDNQIHKCSIRCSQFKRYLFAQSYQNAHTASISMSVDKLANEIPTNQTVVFDIVEP